MSESKPKVTPWFSGDMKPMRKGVFERGDCAIRVPVFSRWNGQFWCRNSLSKADAARARGRSSWQDLSWRGLTRPAT